MNPDGRGPGRVSLSVCIGVHPWLSPVPRSLSKKRVGALSVLRDHAAVNDFKTIETVIRHVAAHARSQPRLEELAARVHLSPFHFHRLFKRWVGTTPKDFLQHLTALEARRLLQEGNDVLGTALEVGLSGPGRLHDLCVHVEAASPGEIRRGGRGWTITAGAGETPFGRAWVARMPRGIGQLVFTPTRTDEAEARAALASEWPEARIVRDDADAARLLASVFHPARAGTPGQSWTVWVKGSAFQLRVWRALVRLPVGSTAPYAAIARSIGAPKACRAVGSAVGRNPVAYLIPCHRVIQSTGASGDYRWGPLRKKALLAWEACRAGR